VAHPRSLGLSAALGIGSVVIVLIAVLAMALSSENLLTQLAERQALTRAQLAAAGAREYLRRVNEDVFSAAQVLAERPTLQRLIERQSWRAMEPVLKRFCASSGGDLCAVLAPGVEVASGPVSLPWSEVQATLVEQGQRFVIAPRDGSAPISGAALPSLVNPTVQVVVLRRLEGRVLQDLRDQLGAEVRLVNYSSYVAPPEDPYTPLHSLALSDGRYAAQRLEDPPVYAATTLLPAVTGEVVALIDVELPAAEFDAAVRSLTRRLSIIALIVIAIAGFAGVLYGRWMVGPVSQLRAAADRIGRGNFSTAIPSGGTQEVSALAATMEEMRRNLVDLTAALRRREAEAQAVLGGVVEGVYAVDLDRRIRYANPQAARIVGRDAQEIVGQFCGDVLRPEVVDGQRPCEHSCPIVLARMQGTSRAVERLCIADGTVRTTVIQSAAPVDGQQVQVIRDETELEAVRRARDSVLANISHEFRTPLAAQLASIELLHDGIGHLTGAEQKELFSNLERGVLRLMRLIDNLLESVRIESGQLGIRRNAVVASEVVEEATAFVQPLLAQRRQVLEVDLPKDLPMVSGDAQRLTQVFVNLISNAGKFAPESSAIRVGGAAENGELKLWVEDEGPGIDDADRGTLFEQFTRASGDEPAQPGLGLGLWIVKSIIERHGGDIDVVRTPEQRTRFVVTLPIEAPE
jgi:signal transduction histidine kinase/HAMP domain-containing protein